MAFIAMAVFMNLRLCKQILVEDDLKKYLLSLILIFTKITSALDSKYLHYFTTSFLKSVKMDLPIIVQTAIGKACPAS